MDVLFIFEWLDGSFLATISKAYGGVFAVVQMFHLLSMALLGGMVLVGDLRLLNVLLTDVPSETVVESTNKWFTVGLIGLVLSGIFMSSAVALKLYYNEMYWAKMASLALGVVFVYAIRRPLLRYAHDSVSPMVLKVTGLTSIVIWFTVAGTGRWIGFS
jgi:hypothetical protein